ncbi:hypothetical protein MNBD_PLANCTO02-3373, partial [hydrothermal vent metagenome]
SSVSFPEAVQEIQEDILTISARLKESKVKEITLGIEQDVIEALEVMIEALQKEIEKAKEEKEEPPPEDEPKEPADPELVDKLAELKMLRSLQRRVNARTKRMGRMYRGEQAKNTDVVDQLQKLSKRQARIQKAAYDLATERNK